MSTLTPCLYLADQGNLQGPKGLKAKRSREYFEVKHLGVEKKKRGRKRKSELMLRDPSSMKRAIVEATRLVTVGGGPVIAVRGPKPMNPLQAQQNGTITSRPVSTASSTVQTVVPAYQSPGNVHPPPLSQPTNTVPCTIVSQNLVHNPVTTMNTVQGGHTVMTQVKLGIWFWGCPVFFFRTLPPSLA